GRPRQRSRAGPRPERAVAGRAEPRESRRGHGAAPCEARARADRLAFHDRLPSAAGRRPGATLSRHLTGAAGARLGARDPAGGRTEAHDALLQTDHDRSRGHADFGCRRAMKKVLITGGAGFIGGHVAEELLAHGYDVRVVDSLDPQVHEEDAFPAWLDGAVERIEADVRDTDAITRALSGVDAVVHLAAVVGVGQSMYQLRRYVGVNSHGTATLLEALAERPVQRLLVA